MKRLILLAFILLFLGVSLARAQDVRYNFDSQANFAAFKTYKWAEIKGADRPNTLVDKQIRDALEAGLAAKGLQGDRLGLRRSLHCLPDCHRYRKAIHLLQHRLGLWPGLGRWLVWSWGLWHYHKFNINDLRWAVGR